MGLCCVLFSLRRKEGGERTGRLDSDSAVVSESERAPSLSIVPGLLLSRVLCLGCPSGRRHADANKRRSKGVAVDSMKQEKCDLIVTIKSIKEDNDLERREKERKGKGLQGIRESRRVFRDQGVVRISRKVIKGCCDRLDETRKV